MRLFFEFERLTFEVQRYAWATGALPASISEALKGSELHDVKHGMNPIKRDWSVDLPLVVSQSDPWGGRITMTYHTGEEFDRWVVIHSNGPNGLDEQGGGDDVEERFKIIE
jgi:hypothetical protein